MNVQETEQQSLHISQEKLLTFVHAMLGGRVGREDDEHPLPPGPWDPHIRRALEQIYVLGPHPEPWRRHNAERFLSHPVSSRMILAILVARHPEIADVIGGGHSFGDAVALNPQPLPPRYAFLVALAEEVSSRAELFQEITDFTSRNGEQQGIIIVGGYISRLSDDFCGTGFRLRWPFPGPPPHWFPEELDGIDSLVIASQFDEAAKRSFSTDLRHALVDASSKFSEAGFAKMR